MNDHANESHDHHHEESFVSKYIFSLDHKMIGKQFLIYGLIMFIVGGGLALLFRWQLAWPDKPLPIIGVSQEYLDEGEVVSGADKMWEKWGEDDEENWFERTMHAGIIGPEFYNALFTMHATIMVFFVVVPLLVGAFGNYLIPLMIGTRDMAFPVLNMLSFWTSVLGAVIMMAGFFVPGGHAAAGWTGYAPLSSVPDFTGVNWGQNLWCIALIVMGVSSLMGSINYITTIINMRAPGYDLLSSPAGHLVALHRCNPPVACVSCRSLRACVVAFR